MKKPESYCSLDTTTRMAARAYSAAKKIDQKTDIKQLFGVAISATLSTNYEKKGDILYVRGTNSTSRRDI